MLALPNGYRIKRCLQCKEREPVIAISSEICDGTAVNKLTKVIFSHRAHSVKKADILKIYLRNRGIAVELVWIAKRELDSKLDNGAITRSPFRRE